MLLEPSQWDPMLMNDQKLQSIFNALVEKVGPNEAQAYTETCRQIESKPVTKEDVCQATKMCWNLARSFTIVVSTNLMARLKPDLNEFEDVRKAYEEDRSCSDAHYDEQMQVGPLSTDDRKHNLLVALHKAISREFYTQLIAHMPK